MGKAVAVLLSLTWLTLLSEGANARPIHPERWYQNEWCGAHHGQAEVTLPDRTRADCLTEKNAVEFDFGRKWAEAIGQALYYGLQTGKRPGVVLILEDANDRKFWIRLNSTVQHYGLPVDTWAVGTGVP